MEKTKAKGRSERRSAPVHVRCVKMVAADGYELAGTIYEPKAATASLLLAPGTGIPAWFYTHFATWLAQEGYAVLTFDFRGIGESRRGGLRGFSASKVDWGRLDMSAAFARLQQEWPRLPHCLFGHSVGGQLIGLMDDAEQLDAVATYGTCFGYWGGMDGAYKYFVAAMWYLAFPVGTSLFGYMPIRRLGLGEDLPAGVARDWARWGRRPDYFIPEIGDAPGFSAVKAPWRAFLATDDKIATEANARPMYEMFQTPIEISWLRPADFGYEEIGHVPFFSRKKRDAWPAVSQWFSQALA